MLSNEGKKFLTDLMKLADELNKTNDNISINMIINDMELLYERHILKIQRDCLKEISDSIYRPSK